MPLLEIIKTPQTSDWVTATAIYIGRRQGKTAIVVNDGPGFYTSRILSPFLQEALSLLSEGAQILQVDSAIRHFGFPVGPFALLDEVGIDVAAHVSGELQGFFASRGFPIASNLEKIHQAGFLGRKNGKGFYLYEMPAWKRALRSTIPKQTRPVNEKIYGYLGHRKHETIDDEEISQRMAFSMMNEAVYCLQDGIISTPRDGDVGAVLGLGFPPFLGGPFMHMDSIGMRGVISMLERLAGTYGPRFQPAPLLIEMEAKGKVFYKN